MLNQDIDLSYKDIQALDSPDAFAAFFAQLGYDTNRRINFTTPPDERTRLLEKVRTLYASCIAKEKYKQ